jgi:hypothetical protein
MNRVVLGKSNNDLADITTIRKVPLARQLGVSPFTIDR